MEPIANRRKVVMSPMVEGIEEATEVEIRFRKVREERYPMVEGIDEVMKVELISTTASNFRFPIEEGIDEVMEFEFKAR